MNLKKDLHQQLSVDPEKYVVIERKQTNLRTMFFVFFFFLMIFFIGWYCGYSINAGFLNMVQVKPKMPDSSEILSALTFVIAISSTAFLFHFLKRLGR